MYRTLEKELMIWKERKEHLPILMRGARQVGKSYLVEESFLFLWEGFFNATRLLFNRTRAQHQPKGLIQIYDADFEKFQLLKYSVYQQSASYTKSSKSLSSLY